ncbi:hypothetical protein HanIR_Chr14g0725621 [Helianthus annuus]|nr:hypothetical protein HanIR_Chr14g0725621 [Helianthus annuus]
MLIFWKVDFLVLGYRISKLESHVALFRLDYVFLTGLTLASEFGLGVSPENYTADCHLTVVLPPQEHNSLRNTWWDENPGGLRIESDTSARRLSSLSIIVLSTKVTQGGLNLSLRWRTKSPYH